MQPLSLVNRVGNTVPQVCVALALLHVSWEILDALVSLTVQALVFSFVKRCAVLFAKRRQLYPSWVHIPCNIMTLQSQGLLLHPLI